jgi:pSer/pThr/pTyr-binding forkhead associated (FHA) protein
MRRGVRRTEMFAEMRCLDFRAPDWFLNGPSMSGEVHTVRIGRGQGCDLVLTHESISRRHAELTIGADGSLYIRDLQSTGGIFILRDGKEQSVTKARLKSTDTLRLGDYEISVEDLLSLVRESQPEFAPAPAREAVATEDPGKPKTRMVRCACGSIKERGQTCPACGT